MIAPLPGWNPVRLLMLLLCLLAAVPLPAADWPQWCGSDGKNMVSAETGLPATFTPGQCDFQRGTLVPGTARDVRWGARIGSGTFSSPVVAQGKVFIGASLDGKGLLKCLDARTGQTLWQWVEPARPVPRYIDGRRFMYPTWQRMLGVCSTPAVEGGRVYFVSQNCEVVCLAAEGAPTSSTTETTRSARVLWKFDMWAYGVRPSDACNGAPLVHGDLLYVSTSNGVDRDPNTRDEDRKAPAPQAPSLIVLDKKTGKLVATDDAGLGTRLYHGQWSSPSLGRVGGRTLIFLGGGDGCCYAFEALDKTPAAGPVKLKTVWRFDCNPPEYKKGGDMDPMRFYCLGDRRRSDSLNKKSDGLFVGPSEIIATPVFHEGRVYVAIGRDPTHGRGRGALWCIDPAQPGPDITRAGKVWCYQGLDRTLSTVSVTGGLVYIADVAGRVHCLEAASGRPLWIHETRQEVWGSTLVADGKLYLPTHKALWVLAAGREKKVLAQIPMTAPIYGSLAAADGALYLATKNFLRAVAR